MNNYQAAAAAAQGYGPPASPHTTRTSGGFPATNSPGPTIDMYSSSGADSVGYVQAASPQPSGYPAIAVSRAPLNYSPVSMQENRNENGPLRVSNFFPDFFHSICLSPSMFMRPDDFTRAKSTFIFSFGLICNMHCLAKNCSNIKSIPSFFFHTGTAYSSCIH